MRQHFLRQLLQLAAAALVLYLLFALLSFILQPLFAHRTPAAGLTGPKAQPNTEQVLCIDDNTDALLWRLRAIEAAQENITLSTFQLGTLHSGMDMLAALQAAAQRGVQVRLIIDGGLNARSLTGNDLFQALASTPGVEIRFYNPISLLRPWQANYRLHDKYLIVDDNAFLSGGRNIGDLFLGDYIPKDKQNVDRDLLVWRPDATVPGLQDTLKEHFEEVWALPTNQTKSRPGKAAEKEAQKLAARYDALKETYPELKEKINFEAETLPVNGIQLLTGPNKPENKAPELWYALRQRMLTGEDVVIQTPYIICNKAMYQDLSELCEDGRKVCIITNAVENGANPFGCTDYLNNRKKILKTGCEVYEHTSIFSIHAKTILVDDRWSIVGSYNLDIRSTYLNSEMMLAVDSPELNAQLRQDFEKQAQESLRVEPDGTETAGSEYAPAPMGLFKKLLYALLRLITLPIRHLL